MQLDPDWVSAIGQVAGAVATFLAVVVALRIAARDRRRFEQERHDEAVGRAAMVLARDDGGNIVVANHGDKPVRDVKVTVGHPSNDRLRWSPNNRAGSVADILPAGATVRRQTTHSLAAPKASWIVLEFVDVEGRQWERVGDRPPTWRREPISERQQHRRPLRRRRSASVDE